MEPSNVVSIVDFSKLPRTSPHTTTVACADGAHEGTHKFKGIAVGPMEFCERVGCGQIYGHPIHNRTLSLNCSGGKEGSCSCLCHPRNKKHSHWHLVNSGTAKRTICLGYNGLKRQVVKEMLPKAYLKRMEDEDDACYERRRTLHNPR